MSAKEAEIIYSKNELERLFNQSVPASVYAKQVEPLKHPTMTKEEYIKTHAAILARCCSIRTPREECKRIKQICGCSMREAEKIFIETIDEVEKIRERNNH